MDKKQEQEVNNNDFLAKFKFEVHKDNPYSELLKDVIADFKEKKIPLNIKVEGDNVEILGPDVTLTTLDSEGNTVTNSFSILELMALAQLPSQNIMVAENTTVTLHIGTLQEKVKGILEEYQKKQLLSKEVNKLIPSIIKVLHLDAEPKYKTDSDVEFLQTFVNSKFKVFKNHVMKFGINGGSVRTINFNGMSKNEFDNFRRRVIRLKEKCDKLYKQLLIANNKEKEKGLTPYISTKTHGNLDSMLSVMFDKKTEPLDISKDGTKFNFWTSNAVSEITLSIGTDKITERNNDNKGLSITSNNGSLLKSITTDKLLKYITYLAIKTKQVRVKLSREEYFNICNGYNITEFNETLDIDSNIIRNSYLKAVFDSDVIRRFYSERLLQQLPSTKGRTGKRKEGKTILDSDICSSILLNDKEIMFTITEEYLDYVLSRQTARYNFHLALMTISERYRKEYYIGCKLNQYYKNSNQVTYHKTKNKKKRTPTTKGHGIIPEGHGGIKLSTLLSPDIEGLFRKDKPILPDLIDVLDKLFEFGYLSNWFFTDSVGNATTYETNKREQNRELLRSGWLIYQEKAEVLEKPLKNKILSNILTNGSDYFSEKAEPSTD